MHASTAIFLFAASAALAQTTVTSGCGSQVDDIISNCLGTEGAQLAACAANDWDCMCTQQHNVVTCYNNCPGDPAGQTAADQETTWCNAAALYGTTTSLKPTATVASGGSTPATASQTGESIIPENGALKTGTDEPDASPTTGSAVRVAAPGLLAAFVGAVALF